MCGKPSLSLYAKSVKYLLWVVIRLDLFQIKYVSKWVFLIIRNLVPTGHIVRALYAIDCF